MMSDDAVLENNLQKDWYLVYTKPRKEEVAADNLIRQGYEVFLPKLRESQQGRRMTKNKVVPLFSRYLFISLNCNTDQWAPIRSTLGVSMIVRFGSLPLAVPETLVNRLKTEVSEHGYIDVPEKTYTPGEAVRINDGTLAGYEAIFSARNGNDRVIVLLNIIGQQSSVSVPKCFVEAIA